MGLGELALALLLCAAAAVGSSVPVAAWSQTRELRFLLVASANLSLLVLGVVWVYGMLRTNAPVYTATTLPALGLTALAAVLFLMTGAVPRRA
jgi:hypothetical protein